jgi:prophage regulatory protein
MQSIPAPSGTDQKLAATGSFPDIGFVRLWQIIGDPEADPPVPPIIPVKKSCWWDGVRTGRFPKPVKLGPRVTVWRVEDIRALIASA